MAQVYISSPSLFESGPSDVLAATVQWLEGMMLGTVATALSIIAVAIVGFSMLSGRLAIRDGVRVVVGCLVLFGAPSIALALRDLAGDAEAEVAAPTSTVQPGRAPIAPSTYDPYAGASLRDDRPGQ